jgi:hypothetical protein
MSINIQLRKTLRPEPFAGTASIKNIFEAKIYRPLHFAGGGLLLSCLSGCVRHSAGGGVTKRPLGRGGWGGEFRRVGGGEHGVDDGLVLECRVAELADMLRVDVFLDGAEIADAELGGVGAFVEIFVAVLAFGLEFAEFGGAFVEEAMVEGAGAIDGELEFGLGFMAHGVGDWREVGVVGDEGLFDFAAASETPHGAADFVDEVVFEDADGGEFGAKLFAEVAVVGFFAGADEVAGGVEAEGGGVQGGDGAAFGSAGSADRVEGESWFG